MFDHVLLIDDDRIYCEITKTYLMQSGVGTVLVLGDGRDALNILKQNISQIDFIILDLNMPEFDGIEFLTNLKDLAFTGPIAVVSSETPVVIDMAASLGKQHGLNIIDALKKPLTKDHIDRWLAS